MSLKILKKELKNSKEFFPIPIDDDKNYNTLHLSKNASKKILF